MAAVEIDIEQIAVVELAFQPRPAVGDDAESEEQLAAGVNGRSKQMPGERCNWLTITRSAPLITKLPEEVMSGISPMYTFSSFVPLASLSRKVTCSGAL